MTSPIVTRVGHVGFGDHRFCGKSALTELMGHESYTGMLVLALLGRTLLPEDLTLIDDLVAAVCAADPRIWPLKITRLTSAYGDLFAGLAAGQLCMSGSETIGPWVAEAAADILVEVDRRAATAGGVAPAIAAVLEKRSRYPGWGVGFRHVDERVTALEARVRERGRTESRFWQLYVAVSDAIRIHKGIEPNITACAAALLLDMGCTPREAALINTFAMQLCFVANAAEGAALASPALRHLAPENVLYVGEAPRRSPRSLAATRRSSKDVVSQSVSIEESFET
jgi:hypothetical protein